MISSLYQVCSLLKYSHDFADFSISKVASIANPTQNSITFTRQLTKSQIKKVIDYTPICIIVENIDEEISGITQIKVENARLAIIYIIRELFTVQHSHFISNTAIIHKTAKIGNNVSIGDYTIIGANSTIEQDCEIMSHVIIGENVHCAKGTKIKSGSVIGQKGFGFERDEEGTPIEFPHIGGVLIGEQCEIGALNTIVSGTIEPTIVGNYVKTDDHVHIAHNVIVGDKTLIAACAEISGSVTVGTRVWISPNATIINKISIGDSAFIGIGAVVTKSVPNGHLVAGNPAKFVREVRPGKDPV